MDPAKGPRTTPKPKLDPGATAPALAPWEATLQASRQFLWPTQYTTLTATANQDVGPTPFYLSIYDVATGTRVAVCGTGTSCTATVSQPTEGTRRYVAYASRYDVAHPPPGILGASSFAQPTWAPSRDLRQVSLEVERQTFGVASVRVTATTNVELDVSVRYYLEIFDNSSGQLVAICGMGTTCSIVWKRYWFDIGWDSFVAFVNRCSATIPDSPIASSTVADSIYPANTQHPVP